MTDDPGAGHRLLIVGPPGAGKGTQAVHISQHYGIPAISTGDIFRENVRSRTELGVLAKSYMDRGEYVPDSVTNDLVEDRLNWADAERGFLLDGYPRTVDQVRTLDAILERHDHRLDAVIELHAETEEIVERLLKRAKEQNRADDTEDVIRRRLEVYLEHTSPLIEIYEKRGLLLSVNGLGELDDVSERIFTALEERSKV